MELISRVNGFIAIRTEDAYYTIVELLGLYLVEPGDEIIGDLDSLGSETLHNATKGEEIEVFIQDTYASRERALELLKMR